MMRLGTLFLFITPAVHAALRAGPSPAPTSRRAACLSAVAAAFCHHARVSALNVDEAIAVAKAPIREWCGMVRCEKEYDAKLFDTAGVSAE